MNESYSHGSPPHDNEIFYSMVLTFTMVLKIGVRGNGLRPQCVIAAFNPFNSTDLERRSRN